MKKILVVLVLFCCVFLLDCHPIYAEETIKGNCGESVFWEYSNGLLRIYGNGEMKTNPWMNYRDCRENLRKVIIDEGVTAACEKAFNTTEGDSLEYDYMADLPDKYLPLLSHEWSRRFTLKKGKVYYIQCRSIPFRYFGVPSETCWGQTFKVKVK